MSPDDETPEVDLSHIDSMNDEDLDKLAASLGLGGSDDDAEGEGSEDADNAGGLEEGSDSTPKESEAPAPRLTGKALLDGFKEDPEAQRLVQAELENYLRQASAQADAKKEQEEFAKLVAEGDFEEIGRRYVTQAQRQQVQSQVTESATIEAYREIYGSLFKELNTLELSDDDRKVMDHTQYSTDPEYVLALSNLIASKKAGGDIEAKAKARADEILTALKNKGSATVATGGSVSSLPAGAPNPDSGKETSRSLIQDGFRDVMEQRSEERILA